MSIPACALLTSHLFKKASVLNNLKRANTWRFISTTRLAFANRLFTPKHEWIELEGNVGTVGISQYAQEALGDVVYAQLPEIGTSLKQEDECGALESVKAASEIYSPVSGVITDKNKEVEETPSLINTSAYEKGWLFKIEVTKVDELQNLMNEEAYKEFLKKNESH